jgi:hypothetical protein
MIEERKILLVDGEPEAACTLSVGHKSQGVGLTVLRGISRRFDEGTRSGDLVNETVNHDSPTPYIQVPSEARD